MQRFAVWLFIGWARPALFLTTLAIAVTVIHRHVSDGLAACVGLLSLGAFGFLKSLDRMAREASEPRPKNPLRAARRRARTDWWRRHILALAEHDRGPQGDRARRIVARWAEVKGETPDAERKDVS